MNTTYLRFELRRVFRSRRALFFSVLLPLGLFEAIGPTVGKQIGGTTGLTFYMVSMATFGIMSATFTMAGRIAAERSIGWNRQLRLTALPGWQYVATKLAIGFAIGVPSMLVILVFGRLHGVHVGGSDWALAAVSIVLAVLPVAVAGVLVGYLIDKIDSAQQIIGLSYTAVAFLAGIYVPIDVFPRWFQHVLEALPFPWIPIAGRKAIEGGWLGWEGTGVIAAWTVVLGLLAARAYVRDTHRV